MSKLKWVKDTNGEVRFQPPCPKRGNPALDQRGFWSAQSQSGQRFIIEPVYGNSPTKAWFHILHYTLSDGEGRIYYKGKKVSDCKTEATRMERNTVDPQGRTVKVPFEGVDETCRELSSRFRIF